MHIQDLLFKEPVVEYLPSPILFTIQGLLEKKEEEEEETANGISKEWFQSLSRIHQMHINVVYLYLTDPNRFWHVSFDVMKTFAVPNSPGNTDV